MSEAVGEVAEKSKNLLSNKIGPLPTYAYALIIIAVVWGVYLFKRRQGGAPVAEDAVDLEYDAGNPTSPINGGPIPPAGSYDGIQGGTNGSPAASSNAIWARNATNQLIAEGADPVTVTNAIAKYLAGTPLSAAEKAIVSLAITKFGSPPEGVIPVKVAPTPVAPKPVVKPAPKPVAKPAPKPVPKPAPKPAPPKKPAQIYTVRPGDSLSLIAHKFYGNYNWAKIYAANRKVVGANPNLIHPGQRLVIPA